MRAAEGRGGGRRRVGCGNIRDVGLASWIEGRIGGIGLICGGDGTQGQFWRCREIAPWRTKFSVIS